MSQKTKGQLTTSQGWAKIAMLKGLLFSISFIVFNSACTEEPDLGNIEYVLKNTTETSVGFKVRLLKEANATIVGDSVVLKSGEELVIVKSHDLQDPKVIFSKIEIWNSDLKAKYKDVNLEEYTQENDRYTLTFGLPYRNTSDIVKFQNSVHLYMDQTSLFGFYPIVDYPRITNFFRTQNSFQQVVKALTPTSTPNADFKMVNTFGSTLIGYNAWSYADKTLFIKSSNNGDTWEPFFEFGFTTSNDAFTATDFVNETTGWLSFYKTVFNGQFAQTYATDVYRYNSGNVVKISTINTYGIYLLKFLNASTGYALANTSYNTIPPSSQETYFMKTVDGGVTWSAPVTVSDKHRTAKLFKLANGKLIAFCNSSHPLLNEYKVSTDDGATWQTEAIPVTGGVRDLFFLPNGTGYLKTGTNGLWSAQNVGDVYKTTNGGTTWTKIKEGINGSIIWFYDDNTGYLQDLISTQGQVLYVTRDGGATWKEVLYPYDFLIK